MINQWYQINMFLRLYWQLKLSNHRKDSLDVLSLRGSSRTNSQFPYNFHEPLLLIFIEPMCKVTSLIFLLIRYPNNIACMPSKLSSLSAAKQLLSNNYRQFHKAHLTKIKIVNHLWLEEGFRQASQRGIFLLPGSFILYVENLNEGGQ